MTKHHKSPKQYYFNMYYKEIHKVKFNPNRINLTQAQAAFGACDKCGVKKMKKMKKLMKVEHE